MSIIAIEVKADCDRCGKFFIVEMDPAQGWTRNDPAASAYQAQITIFDVALDAIEHSHEKGDILAPASVLGSEVFCSGCTKSMASSLEENAASIVTQK